MNCALTDVDLALRVVSCRVVGLCRMQDARSGRHALPEACGPSVLAAAALQRSAGGSVSIGWCGAVVCSASTGFYCPGNSSSATAGVCVHVVQPGLKSRMCSVPGGQLLPRLRCGICVCVFACAIT